MSALIILVSFLRKIIAHAPVNKMTAKNLAIVFAPNILRGVPPSNKSDLSASTADISQAIHAIQLLLERPSEILHITITSSSECPAATDRCDNCSDFVPQEDIL